MKKAREPVGEARDDYAIFAAIAQRLGAGDAYTEGRDTQAWLSHLYELSRVKSAEAGVTIPPFEEFWQAGIAEAEGENREPVMLAAFRADPAAHPLKTPSGKIEIYSEKIASFGYDDCPGHAVWLEPIEWLGSQDRRALSAAHAVGPAGRQAAQPARPQPARARHQDQGPPADHASIPTMPRRAASPTAILCACSTTAAPAWRRRASATASGRGVVRLSTGAWFDPADSGSNRPLEKHGNPNVLTLDIGASKLSQGCIAQTCLVEIERFDGPAPPVTAHRLPEFAKRY